MLISEDIINQLCPSYQKAILKFESDYSALTDDEEKKKLLEQFSYHYLTPKEYWDEWFNVIGETFNYKISQEKDNLSIRAAKHFCFYQQHIRGLSKKNLNRHYNNGDSCNHTKVEDLQFPQPRLDEDFRSYEKYSSSPPPKKLIQHCQSMKKLYSDIILSINDFKTWFKHIKKVDDEEFVAINVENRLADELTNKKLWKLYINFLSDKDKKKMLEVYSKYCRFFIDDKEMWEEYQRESNLHGPIVVEWKNTFNFEVYEEFKAPIYPEYSFEHEKILLDEAKNCDEINIDNFQMQTFAFPKTIINYILKSQNCSIRHKLHKSCKYFFAINPTPVCYRFHCDFDTKFIGSKFEKQSFLIYFEALPSQYRNFNFNRKLCLSTTLTFYDDRPYYLSSILENVYSSEIKYLSITRQSITVKEFNFLVENGNIESLTLKNVKIASNDEPLPLEEIYRKTPKLLTTTLHNIYITPNTAQILSELSFKNKINHLKLINIGLLEPVNLAEFINKNLTQNAYFGHSTKRTDDENDVIKCNQIVCQCVNEFWQDQEKPFIRISK